MPVYANSGPGLGQALVGAGENFLTARRGRRQDELFEQQMADHLYQQTRQKELDARADARDGFHRGPLPASVGQEIVSDIQLPAGPAASFSEGLSNAAAPKFSPDGGQMPSRAAAGASNIPGKPQTQAPAGDATSQFRDLMAQMGGGAPSRGPRFEFSAGGYTDHKPEWQAQDAARSQKMQDQFAPMLVQRMMAQQERDRKIAGYVAAGVDQHRAQLYVDNPALADNDPKVGKQAAPKSMEHVDLGDRVEMRDPVTGKVVETIRKGKAPGSDAAAAVRESAIQQRKDALGSRTEARMVSQYHNATKKYSQTADALQAIAENRAGALRGDPVAQQTLLQDFIKLNLPGQIVTEGELHHYAGLMGLGDKGGQLLQKLQQGSPLSETQIKLILQHSDNLAAERRKGAKFLRDSYIQRGARQGVPDDAFEDWFGFLPDEQAAGHPAVTGQPGNIILGGDTAGQTIIVNGKTFKVPH